MRTVALMVVAAIQLGGVFGSAGATVESLDEDSMTITLTVEVVVSSQAVVAHLSLEGEQPQVISLLDRGGGVFGIRTELERRDYVVVFEAIGPGGGVSVPRSLSQLGAELTLPGESGGQGDPEEDPETRRLGWLALALAAASLSALAFWALGGTDGESGSPDAGASTEEE